MIRMKDKELEFFKDIHFKDLHVSGRSFQVPFQYYDFSRITARFPVSSKFITKVLPSTKLIPVEVKAETTFVTFVAFEYRKMKDLSPYNEFGILIPVIYKDDNIPGSYLTHLPVTTEEARWGGVEIYGYPKFIADITFDDMEKVCKSKVSLDGKEIVKLEVEKMATKLVSNDFFTYTLLDNKIVRTQVQTKGFLGTGNDSSGASVHLGEHPIAKEIKALRIAETPINYTYSPRMQCLLHGPDVFLPL
jgi:hypothetical protein